MSKSPRFPKPSKRPWKTAWRSDHLRDEKDVRIFLAIMFLCWGLVVGIAVWGALSG